MTPDKYLHFIVSAILCVAGAFATGILPIGIFAALAFGAAKEIWDVTQNKHGKAEAWMDMLANAVGIAAGAGIALWLGS